MPRRFHGFLRSLLLIVLLAAASCAAAPVPATPAASATPVHTVTPTLPPPTAAPSPTPVDPAALAEELLRANPDRRCGDERSLYCSLPYSVRIFEYLHQYPQSPRRTELTERVIDLMGTEEGGRLPLDWFVDRWLDEALRQPIAAAGGQLPPGFAEGWQPHGTIQVTDLDADTVPDYLVAFHIGPPQVVEREGGLRWVHRVANTYQIERLPTLVDSRSAPLEPEILAVQDVNGDGRADVVYQMTICGASQCFEHLHVFSWRAGAWWDLLPAAVNTVHRGWTLQDLGGGVAELIGSQGGSSMFEPFISYAVYFAPINGEFAPVRVSSSLSPAQADDPPRQGVPYAEIETDTLFLQWSQRLTYARRLSEALEFIAPVANRATVPETREKIDYRPYARLRLGMAQLLLGDVAAARQAWQQLERQFPDTAHAEVARQLLPLA
ncbi:hypothetical protein EKD04_005715 [Chloroflexales bacterium ZM16-3]|nr:hypothetical protein [Chloroflexales bacterium ZM16-3]